MLISQVLVAIRIFSVTRKSQCFSVICKMLLTQPAISCSKLAIETLEQRCEICSKLTIKLPKRRYWRRFGSFIVNFEHISHLCSSVSIVDFEQVKVKWNGLNKNKENLTHEKKHLLNNLILKMQKLSHFARLIRKYCWFQGQIMLQDLVCIRLMFLCFEEMVAYQIAGYSNLEAIFH